MTDVNAVAVAAEVKPVGKPAGFTLTTTGEPVNESIDRQTIGALVIESIDWTKAEDRESERTGQKYKTTRSISWNMSDADDRRYQIVVSVNRWEPKQAREALGGKAGKQDSFKLGQPEIQFIEAQQLAAETAGDAKRAGQFMTLKLTNQLSGGISKAQLTFLMGEVEKLAASK